MHAHSTPADEEGLIEDDVEMSATHGPGSTGLRFESSSSDSNLGMIISNIKEILIRFQSQPLLHIDKDNA
jgi:hypothetical protein